MDIRPLLAWVAAASVAGAVPAPAAQAQPTWSAVVRKGGIVVEPL